MFDLNNFNQMMVLSLSIGITHIAMGLMIKVQHKTGQNKLISFSWFWQLSLSLVYLFAQTEFWLMAMISTPVIWIINGCIYGRSLLQKLKLMFMPLLNISKLFGDVLSYMRLFALGLASASLAITFNQLASDVQSYFPGIGFFLALLILILGHSLNFTLGIMGGVVHSLRLNCIELFHWALDNEGRPFTPFKPNK